MTKRPIAEWTTPAQRERVLAKFKISPSGAANLSEFFARAEPTFGCDGAIALPWEGMWLCIERDGYCHS